MTARTRNAAAAVAAAVAITTAAAGCGSGTAAAPAGPPAPPAPSALATALSASGTMVSAAGAAWATVRTGGRITGGRFWQLLVRPAGSSRWRLATPPGVADNGGLAVAGAGNSLTAGFVPNALLRFTPLAASTDGGASWSQGLLQAGITAAPSALAVLPGGRLVAITARGAEISGPGGTDWSPLITLKALAASPAGRSCGLVRLTAVAASPAGEPLLAGQCRRPGVVEVFERSADGWHAAGRVLPGPLRGDRVSVLQMVATAGGTQLLLVAGAGRAERVLPASLAGEAASLTVGAPLAVTGRPVTSTAFAASGGWAVVFGGRSALPGPDATLVPGSPLTALVPGLDTVAVWQQAGSGRWQRVQVLGVPSAPS